MVKVCDQHSFCVSFITNSTSSHMLLPHHEVSCLEEEKAVNEQATYLINILSFQTRL